MIEQAVRCAAGAAAAAAANEQRVAGKELPGDCALRTGGLRSPVSFEV